MALKALLVSTTWGSYLLKFPLFGMIEDAFFKLLVNYLANKGLIVLNIVAIVGESEIDQNNLDSAIESGLRQVQLGRDKLTLAQGKAIDESVRKAARRFIKFNP